MTIDLPDEEICEKYISGRSSHEIAEEYKCGESTIRRRLDKYGIKVRTLSESHVGRQAGKNHPGYVDLPTEKICKKYLSGISACDIAKEYKCHTITIVKRLHVGGVEIRSRKYDLPIEEVCEKYLTGISAHELAREYKCDIATIMKRLHEGKVELRSIEELGRCISAQKQGIPYDEWESYACESLYCPLFNNKCRESNRDKYDRRCFLTGLPECENLTKTGKHRKLSVHHVDMDKQQGCNGHRWRLVPLCMNWHGKAHTELWKSRIIWLLENIWNDGIP